MKMLRTCAILCFALFAALAAGAQTDRYNTTYPAEAKTLNYFYTPDTLSQRIAANTQDGLVENDKYGRFQPSLAASWTSSPDFKVWTFNLRKGVMWVDYKGAKTSYEITADDFVEGARYIADPKHGIKNLAKDLRKLIVGLNDYFLDLGDIDSGKKTDVTRDAYLANFDKNVGIKATDKYTVVYTLTKPTPWFLSYLVMELFLPVEKEFLGKSGEDFGVAKDKLLYSGAYYMSDWQRDKQIVLKANPFYWDAAKIKVKTINLQKVTDPLVNVQMFQRGELSAATLAADQVKALAGTKWADYVFPTDRSSVTYWFAMNFTAANPEFKAFANNVNFRRALYYGIDRVKLCELYDPYNPAGLLRNGVIPEENIFDDKGKDYTDYPGIKAIQDAGNYYNKKKAQDYFAKALAELVDASGNIKGVTAATVDYKPIADLKVDGKLPLQMVFLHSTDATDTKLALLFKAMLEDTFGKQNIEVVLGQYTDDIFNDAVEPRKFDMFKDSFRFGFADPSAQLSRLITGGAINDGQYSDATFDKMVDDANAKNTLSERYTLFAKAEAYFLDNAYVIPWMTGGGAYNLTKMVPYTYPRGGFGITRFKYKGAVVESAPITAKRYTDLRATFYKELEALSK